jgi:hypothetical protein
MTRPDAQELVAAALLIRAAELAATTRDRQLVAIAGAYLEGDSERVDVLAREHLVDYPDNVLVAWIAEHHKQSAEHHKQTAEHPQQTAEHHKQTEKQP